MNTTPPTSPASAATPTPSQGEPVEITLKKRELRLSFWTNTILVAVLGGIGTVVFSLLDVKQKQDELLHQQRVLRLNSGELEFKLVGDPLQQIIKAPCSQAAKAQLTYLNVILNVGIVEKEAAGKYEEIGRLLTGTCTPLPPPAPVAPEAKCTEIKSIIALGWTSGHKTNYCISKGYQGVWNRPNSSYSSGGFCYKGDDAACKSAIEAGQ